MTRCCDNYQSVICELATTEEGHLLGMRLRLILLLILSSICLSEQDASSSIIKEDSGENVIAFILKYKLKYMKTFVAQRPREAKQLVGLGWSEF